MSNQSQFTTGQPVTVTIDDGHGETLVIDGFIQRDDFFVTTDMSRSWSTHIPTPSHRKNARAFLIVESASGQNYGHDLDRWRTGPDHAFNGDKMWVAVEATEDGPRALVVAADGEALARIDATLSPERIVNKAIAALSETDPALAQRLRGAVEEIDTAAYIRGGDNASEYI
jgi:hypothetical protein